MIRYTFIALVVACAGPVTQQDSGAAQDAGVPDASCTCLQVVCIRELGATDDVCVAEREVVVACDCDGGP